MKIINLTQHKATPEQGVEDLTLKGECLATSFGLRPDQFGYYPTLSDCLTFTWGDLNPANGATAQGVMRNRACLLASIACRMEATHAMIGGAGFFIPQLERALKERGVTPIHAFSERVSVETTDEDGTVIKTNVFKHVGFIESGVNYSGDAPSWVAPENDPDEN
jgi:hypothetical protein